MTTKDKLNLMDEIKAANEQHIKDWKEGKKMFRIIFWSKEHETYERVEHVEQVLRDYDKRTPVYYCHLKDGNTLTLPCSKFIIERIEIER